MNLESITVISKSTNNLLSPLSCSWFKFFLDTHNYEIFWSSHGNLRKPSYRTNIYGKTSSILSSTESRNKGQNHQKKINKTFVF